jgi:restriction endonuclease S subunit
MHVMGSQLARDQLELAIVGSTTAAKLSKGRLLEVEVPIPALDIQRRIADRLDAIQALMQASTREVEALQALRPALATKLLSGGPPASDLSAVPSMS